MSYSEFFFVCFCFCLSLFFECFLDRGVVPRSQLSVVRHWSVICEYWDRFIDLWERSY